MTFAALEAQGPKIELRNLRLNLRGDLLVDVVLTSPPALRAAVPVKVEYGTVTDTLQVTSVATVNVPRTATASQPFPCNETHKVRATVLDLQGQPLGSHSIEATLTRKCSGTQGTPDLTIVSMQRVPGAGESVRARPEDWFTAAPQTPVRVKVVVKNASPFSLPFNEQGGTPWRVQVTLGGAQAQTVRLALQAGAEYALEFVLVVACRQLTDVTAWVDVSNAIRESNENNNKLTTKIPGNSCGNPGN